MEAAYAQPIHNVLKSFGSDPTDGLSDGQVSSLRQKHGKNSPTPIWELILEQFKDQLVLILLGSAAVSLDWPSLNKKRAGILTILILNAVVGVSQESSAEKAIAALQEYSANEANVIRNGGHVSRVKAEELVPGDIISIHVGDRIPADCRLVAIESNNFAVDQAILTGESESGQGRHHRRQ
ncbi:unnamed protein product [Parascedosporium putredinis]|uniref:Cation-transporting P-type ATPase N-terminal domain-containing protein n=1 Tax=Parascedosporium putredinis TaxID=1442378 RepID=A0A9P1H6U8_9PEZI|nr:unnamed protein product [Parascedosporium putredinis]CAI7998968.1 unnamed protein product [Parascedosporium putredinis]